MRQFESDRIQQQLTQAHGNVSAVLAHLVEVIAAIEPGAARAGLHEMHCQAEQLYALTLLLKRRVRHWDVRYAGSDAVDETLSQSFDEDPAAAYDGSDADEEDDDSIESDEDEPMGYEFLAEHDDEPEADGLPPAEFLDDWWRFADIGMGAQRSGAGDASPIPPTSRELALLFGISEEQAEAGVSEVGYVNIFGDWVPGRRPGRYIRPVTPPTPEDPDYNIPGTSS